MGYVKYAEDISDEVSERNSKRSDFDLGGKKTIYYDCKYCGMVFDNKQVLFNHIKAVHNIIRPIVIINDKVVGDDVVIQFVDTAKIELYGYNEEILLNNKPLNIFLFDEPYDFSEELKKEISITGTAILRFSNAEINIEYSPIHIQDDTTIQNVIKDWESALERNIPLSVDVLEGLDGGNGVFLTGLYNYYLACNTGYDINKAKRYDDAWSCLIKFNELNGLGRCVLKIISFRRNWLEKLRALNNNDDDFQYVLDFFDCKPSIFYDNDAVPFGKLYIEESISNILTAILMFQHENYAMVKELLLRFGNINLISDQNLIDKILFLSARLQIIDGNIQKAKELCDMINTYSMQEKLFTYIEIGRAAGGCL